MAHPTGGVRHAVRLAVALDRPVYDCVYLALAHRIEARLTTGDARIANAPAPTEYGGTVVTKRLEDFLEPMRLGQSELARAIGVHPRRINEVVLGKRAVTAETDLLLARYFGLSEGIFLGFQADDDLERTRLAAADRLVAIRPRCAA